jgi:hypothetical protein
MTLAEAQISRQDAAFRAAGATGASSRYHRRKLDFFEDGPRALVEARRAEALRKPKMETAGESKPAMPPTPPTPVLALPTVQAAPPSPPQKNLTGQEFSLIHLGATDRQILEVLGPPSSRVVIPDDDGHLRETLQYWVKGNPAGTVRLDNGRVIQIETGSK